jgi:hypothetical protein
MDRQVLLQVVEAFGQVIEPKFEEIRRVGHAKSAPQIRP